LIQHTYGINDITNKLHRNKLEFTFMNSSIICMEK
jgi:hypothetical protein